MRLREYLELMGAKIESAEEDGKNQECLRLGRLLQEVMDQYIHKFEKALASPEAPQP